MIVPSIAFILEGMDGTQQGTPLAPVIFQSNLNMMIQFCNIFDAMFPPLEFGQYEEEIIECGFVEVIYIFVFCVKIVHLISSNLVCLQIYWSNSP